MRETELRQHRCCFTGHRPEKLGMPETEVVESLKKEIRTAIADGFQTFISGMARGVDLWAAEIVLALREIWQKKLKIMKNEKHPLDDLKTEGITEKREK